LSFEQGIKLHCAAPVDEWPNGLPEFQIPKGDERYELNSLAVSFVVFACCCVAASVGMILRVKLPEDHLDTESRDVMKLVMGIIATMAALVLGLLIASAKSDYDTQKTETRRLSANIVQVDRLLASYGPEARDARIELRAGVIAVHRQIWPESETQSANLDPAASDGQAGDFRETVRHLSPKTESQRHDQEAVLQLANSVFQTRLLMFEQLEGSISWPLLAVLICWVTLLFLGFGMFSRPHATIAATIVTGAFSVASAVFLIVELSQPYRGFMRIPDTAFRSAMALMTQ
jgi:hypothetical protein